MHCLLSCLHLGAGEVLADSELPMHSLQKLSIHAIDPAPVLSVLAKNAEHCSVSTLGIVSKGHLELVRSLNGSKHPSTNIYQIFVL